MKVTSIDPRTGEIIASFQAARASEVLGAVERARKGQQRWWLELTKEERIERLRALESVLARNKSEVVKTACLETGIPQASVAAGFDSAMRGFSYYIGRYEALQDKPFPLDQALWQETNAIIHFEPHGVIGHIGVWNYPFWQTMITVIPALLTGNSIVFKPSELATMTGLRIAQLVHEAGIPKDVFVPVIGGPSVGKALVRSDCDAIVFTGSMSTGQHIIKHAGVKPLVLELSGNDAGLVCEDANIEQAARGIASGTFSRAGQVCIRIKRVYVHHHVAEPFLKRLIDITSRLNVREQIGPLIREEARVRVDKLVQEAVVQGAKALIGGRKMEGSGFFYEPTVLLLTDDQAEVVRKETFGPVCSVRVVQNEEEALRLANDSDYGLGATVWSTNVERAAQLASRLQVGNVWINEFGRSLNCGEYFQGCKSSGIASSQERLMMFLKKKTVIAHTTSEPRKSWFS